tara:strand:- start:23 stop:709 length:687 start_codon:yes stop_codon:yes gene_type:complete
MNKFKLCKLESLDFDLKTQTTEQGRRYITPSGDAYPSVTTVLSEYNKKAILEWRQRVGAEEANKISRVAANRGTRVHSLCENYLLNKLTELKEQSLMPDVKQMFSSIKPIMDTNIGDVYATEQALYSNVMKLAGRVDCIADWQDELAVIDFKTSSKPKKEEWITNYFMQCAAYAEMFTELTNKPVNKLVVLIAVHDEEPQFFVKEKKDYMQSLWQYIDKYWSKSIDNS